MSSKWTKTEIENILLQLDALGGIVNDYSLKKSDGRPILLGSGGYSYVFEAESHKKTGKSFALKVMGFSDKNLEDRYFKNECRIQKELSEIHDSIVKIYDYAQIDVALDYDLNVVRTSDGKSPLWGQNILKLQFIVLEKLEPVLRVNNVFDNVLYPNRLADISEDEIVKLAYDIGGALLCAHKQNLIHRDVKLENIFYDKKNNRYKLGDFGIVSNSDDGSAETVAFTKGYGAPEVVHSLSGRYDQTADIYSFGMVLYVLLNHLKFPFSNGYSSEPKKQYERDAQLPEPESGKKRLCAVIIKMCQYDPDNRYQNMEEVISAIDAVEICDRYSFKNDHCLTYFGMAFFLVTLGSIFFELSFKVRYQNEFSISEILLCAVLLIKYFRCGEKKEHFDMLNILAAVFGIIYIFQTGFSWWKIPMVLYVTIFRFTPGLVFEFMYITKMVYIILCCNEDFFQGASFEDYKWISLTMLSMAAILIYQTVLFFIEYKSKNDKFYYFTRKYGFIIGSAVIYAPLILWRQLYLRGSLSYISSMIGEENLLNIATWKLGIAGLWGCIFAALLTLWETAGIIMKKLKSHEKKPL